MKRLLFMLFVMPCMASVQLQVNSQKSKQVPLLVGMIGDQTAPEICEVLCKDFGFTGQFEVTAKKFESVPSKKEMHALAESALFALFITDHRKHFEWRLYDTMAGAMVAGKKYKKRGRNTRGWAHNMADSIWTALTGDAGFFSTKIAYCREHQQGTKKLKHVYMADYDGSNHELLVDTPTINVAPRWNNDLRNPLLFYSDFTNTNVRLMVSDLNKKRSVASDFEGVNMIPAFSRDGKKIVYCISRGDGSCQLYFYRRGAFKQITHNDGNNVSPSLSDDGRMVYFCSDFETGNPQIYAFDLKRDALERITDGTGYCASPRYSSASDKLAYSKIIQGTMQIFVYDIKTKTHTQLTYDAGHKEECSWSPCGTKLLYSLEQKGKNSQIVMMSLRSSEKHCLTDSASNCSFPDWSPHYEQYPSLELI